MRMWRPSTAEIGGGLAVVCGSVLLAVGIIQLQWWTLPVIAVVLVGIVALVRLDLALYAMIFLLPLTAIGGMVEGYNETVQQFKRVMLLGMFGAWTMQVIARRSRIYAPQPLPIYFGELV